MYRLAEELKVLRRDIMVGQTHLHHVDIFHAILFCAGSGSFRLIVFYVESRSRSGILSLPPESSLPSSHRSSSHRPSSLNKSLIPRLLRNPQHNFLLHPCYQLALLVCLRSLSPFSERRGLILTPSHCRVGLQSLFTHSHRFRFRSQHLNVYVLPRIVLCRV